MGLLIVHPGTYSTVQDLGRLGYRASGVPLGGTFDRRSATLANALVGNRSECAVVEMTLTGGTYEARRPLALALAGAPMRAEFVGQRKQSRPLTVPSCFTLLPNERLVIGGSPSGARTYLAVAGGWRTPLVLGSRSEERRIEAGQVLPALSSTTPRRQPGDIKPIAPFDQPVRIIEGPDAAQLADSALWERITFRVAPECNRMGIRLASPELPVVPHAGRLSAPVVPGAIQVAGGQAIVLGVACGTMGGYPLVASVISADLDRLGQLRPGDRVRFQQVSFDDARRLDAAERAARHELSQRVAALAADRGIEVA